MSVTVPYDRTVATEKEDSLTATLLRIETAAAPPQNVASPPRFAVRNCYLLPLLTGLLLWASFFLPFLVWIALVPLALLIPREGTRLHIYLGAWLGGFVFFLLGTYWVSYCADWVWVGWVCLSAYLALYFPTFVFVSRVCFRRWNVPLLITVPLIWVALEYVRMYLLSGFGWLLLAHSAYRWERVIQIADLAGVYGVSFVIAVANAAILELLCTPLFVPGPKGMQLNSPLEWRLAFAGLLVFLNVGYGQYRMGEAKFRTGPRVVVVQTNVPQDMKNGDRHSTEVFRDVWDIVRPATEVDADLVVWPETSYPFMYGVHEKGMSNIEVSRKYTERMAVPGKPYHEAPTDQMGDIIHLNFKDGDEHTEAMSRMLSKPMLLGTSYWDIKLSGAKYTNASVLIVPGPGRVGAYHKNHILPFGEYIPFDGNIPFLRAFIPYPADFNFDSDAGENVESLHYGSLNLAPLICFEDTLPDLSRAYLLKATKEKPVDILVNQSNDGWFDNSIEGDYHLAASLFRCVEVRRPMIRSSNTGPSALIDGNGHIVKVFEKEGRRQGVEGFFTAEVPLDGRSTWYVQMGDWLPQLGLLLGGSCLLLSGIRQAINIRRTWNENLKPKPAS